MTYCTKYEDLVSNYRYIVSKLEATVTRRWSIDEKHSVSSTKLHVLTLSHADRTGRMMSCRSWIRCCWSPGLEVRRADCRLFQTRGLAAANSRSARRQLVNLRTDHLKLSDEWRSELTAIQTVTSWQSYVRYTVVADCIQPYKVAQQAWIPLAVARVANVAIG